MNPTLDSLSRSPAGESAPVRRLPSWLVPLVLLAGFALLFLALFRDRLLPAASVETAIVLTTVGAAGEKSGSAASGGMLFQASGWIEPDPLPVKATALIDGVVDSVNVLEGQTVKKGEVLATLVDADARLALAVAEQKHQTLVSTRAAHVASIESARKRLEGSLAQVEAAETLADEAADRVRRYEGMNRNSIPETDIISARLRLARENSLKRVLEAGGGESEAEIRRMEIETRVREDEIAAAAVAVDQAKLAFERTRIVSPIDGRILRLATAPGQKKMLQMDEAESSTIAVLYQPEKLQVRVDVPLADAAGLGVGQKAKVRCGILPDKVFEGEVTRISGEADVQRNTLQAKVRILDPVDQLRPEMLCRVEFLGSATVTSQAGGSLATWVPQSALTDGAVWVADPESQRVSKRAVRASAETRDGHVRIAEGVRPGEHVVLSPGNLREGQRVKSTTSQP